MPQPALVVRIFPRDRQRRIQYKRVILVHDHYVSHATLLELRPYLLYAFTRAKHPYPHQLDEMPKRGRIQHSFPEALSTMGFGVIGNPPATLRDPTDSEASVGLLLQEPNNLIERIGSR